MKRMQAYAQLIRLPNLPSALADIFLGVLVTGSLSTPGRWPTYLFLMLASVCLYCGGMAWNDFFDLEQDRRERPDRPIPSGRITRLDAGVFATALVVVGVGFAAVAGVLQWTRGEGSPVTPAVIASLLMGTIFLYDAWLKRTVVGPVAMGTCRFFNVLLGFTHQPNLLWSCGLYLAILVGLYIVGVTWLARTEARTSSRNALLGAASVMLLSLFMALPLPTLPLPVVPNADASSLLFPYLLAGLGFFIGFPVVAAIKSPTPGRVQSAVKRSLMGLILLDMVLATALAGSAGLVLLVLMAPSVYLNRRKWLYAT